MPPKKSRSVRKTKEENLVTTSKSPKRRSAPVEPKTPQKPSQRTTPITTTTTTPEVKRAKSNSPAEDPKRADAQRRPFSVLTAALLVLVVLIAGFFLTAKGHAPVEVLRGMATGACPCLRDAYSSSANQGDLVHSELASVFLSSYTPLTGLHARSDSVSSVFNELGFVRLCSIVVQLTKAIQDVEELKMLLQHPFSKSSCVVWVADVNLFAKVLSPLKELFEDNTLRGVQIVPTGKKGFLLLVSDKSREELKEDLPHRVVHMLNTVELRKDPPV